MKVIVGNRIYLPAPGSPIAVYLETQDVDNILHMNPDAKLYAASTPYSLNFDNDAFFEWCTRIRARCDDEQATYCSACGAQIGDGEYRELNPDTGKLICKDCCQAEEVAHADEIPETLWLVGRIIRHIGMELPYSWDFQGIFSSKEAAIAACRTENYFIAPAHLDESLPHETEAFPDLMWPLLLGVSK